MSTPNIVNALDERRRTWQVKQLKHSRCHLPLSWPSDDDTACFSITLLQRRHCKTTKAYQYVTVQHRTSLCSEQPQDEPRKERRRTFGRYIFFQHLSQSTFPPSICIHLPSSIAFSHRMHTFARGRLCALRRWSSRPEDNVGLVCDRVGNLGDFVTLSR